jgi:hypothetical protein
MHFRGTGGAQYIHATKRDGFDAIAADFAADHVAVGVDGLAH